MARKQHAVAEHVAGHVADADHGEILRLRVAAQRAEVPLDRLPRALRGDAHALVVVTHRAAGGERVAQPVAVFGGDAVGDVAEGRRALVGRHHQVRVVAVVAHHVLGMHDLAVHEVVGDVEQAVDEALVAGDALGQQRIAVAADRRALDEEAALGTDRHDDGVLDHLCLHQAQHLGAEILAAVGPAQAAACHRAEAQVHALHEGRVHEDLAERHRTRQVGHAVRVELEADVVAVAAALALALEIAGAQGGVDDRLERTQDAVLVEAGHALEGDRQGVAAGVDLRLAVERAVVAHLLEDGGHAVALGHRHDGGQVRAQGVAGAAVGAHVAAGLEAGLEQFHQQPRDQRVGRERLFHVRLRERHPGLLQVLAVAAQHGDLAPAKARRQHQPVEAVALGLARPHRAEGGLEAGARALDIDLAGQRFDLEVLDGNATVLEFEHVGMLAVHPQAEVLQHRQRVRQRDLVAAAQQLEAQATFLAAVQRQAQVVGAMHLGGLADVGGRLVGRHRFHVAGRQGLAEAVRQAQALGLAVQLHQALAQAVLPVAHDAHQLGLERGGIGVHGFAATRPHQHVHLRQRRIADADVGVQPLAMQGFGQHRLDAAAHVGIEAVARDEHQHRVEAPMAVAAHEQSRPCALLQRQDAHRGAREFLGAGLEQFVARQGFQDVPQRLAAVAVLAHARRGHHRLVALAHQRDFPRATVVGAGGVQAEETLLGDGAAGLVEAQYADVVHVARPVHGRARIGLGQDQRVQGGARRQVRRRQSGQRPRLRSLVLAAHDAQATAWHRGEGAAVAVRQHLVLAVAQEGEMVVGGPAQEILRLGAGLVARRHRPRRQVVGDGCHPIAHAFPVAVRGAHVGKRRGDRGVHRVGLGVADQPVGVDMDQRLRRTLAHRQQLAGAVAPHREYRMDDAVRGDAVLGQRHRHRIHQEGHVVVDDLHHAVAVGHAGLRRRIEHPDARLARQADIGEVAVAGDDRRPVRNRSQRQFLRRHLRKEGPAERRKVRGGLPLECVDD